MSKNPNTTNAPGNFKLMAYTLHINLVYGSYAK